MKQIGPSWIPIFKSEIKPFLKGFFDWDSVKFYMSDIVKNDNTNQEFKIEFFSSQTNGKHRSLGYVNLKVTNI